MAYDDSLEQCLTTSRGETYEKKIVAGGGGLGPFCQVYMISFL